MRTRDSRSVSEPMTGYVATNAFSRRPRPRAFRPFIGPHLKGSEGSKPEGSDLSKHFRSAHNTRSPRANQYTPQPFDRKAPFAVVRLRHDGERRRADIG